MNNGSLKDEGWSVRIRKSTFQQIKAMPGCRRMPITDRIDVLVAAWNSMTSKQRQEIIAKTEPEEAAA